MQRIFFTLFLLTVPVWAKMVVAVSLQPQAWLVERIAGDLAEVAVMVPPGASAHTYEPKAAQMVQLSKARLYVACGIEFERIWLQRFKSTNAALTVVQSDEAIAKMPMPAHHHDHGGETHGHDHEGWLDRLHGWLNDGEEKRGDTHVWLSAQQMMLQARAVADALMQADAPNAARYRENYLTTVREIAALDMEIAAGLAPYRGRKFMVFHPAWGYFARDYGLVQAAIELEGKEPKPAQLAELIETAKKERIAVIFVQPRQSPKSAETIAAAIGAKVAPLDPLERDWPQMMRQTAQALMGAMGESSAGR